MNIKNIGLEILRYTINLVLILCISFLINTKYLYATVVKCSDFFNINKSNTTLDGKIDQCINYNPTVETKNGLQNIYDASISDIIKDRDQNIPLYQPDLSLSNGNNNLPNDSSNSVTNNFSDTEIEYVLNNVKLCGDNWNTYAYEKNKINNNSNKNQWYPSFGSYPNSYQYKLEKILGNIFSCDEYYELNDEGIIVFNDLAKNCLSNNDKLNSSECTSFKATCFPIISMYRDSKYCDKGHCGNINESTRNIKNRFYREYLYKGVEFIIPLQANDIDLSYPDILRGTKHLYKKSSGCFDPRLEEDKGYTGLEQRYYFKGNQAAEYACERFEYRGQGCVNYNGKETYGKNSQECQLLFDFAKQCCEHRRNGGVCIYSSGLFSSAISNGKAGNKSEYSTVFNGVQYDFKIQSNGLLNNSYNVAFCSKYANTPGSDTCKLEFSNRKAILLKAYYGQLNKDSEIVENGNTDKICVRTASLHPNNFNLLNGTEIEDLYCDSYYTLCNNPNDESIDPINFTLWNAYYKDDYNKIWTTNTEDGSLIQTDAYGKTKNIYTFNRHCVDSSFKAINVIASITRQNSGSKFSPPSCSDFSKSSSQNSSSYDGLGQAILSSITSNSNINITAPMVECLLETTKNMFLNRAGSSLCKNPDEGVNYEGLCGYDTFGPPISIRHEKYDARYSGDSNAYEYMIGEPLSQEFNIFYKIQSSVRNIIKTIVMLGIVAAGARILISGDLDLFGMKKIKAIITWTIKFALVMYFALSDAWQSKFYSMLMSSTEFIYNKMFQLSLLGYDNYKAEYDEIKCDVRTTTETITKAYTRLCYVENIKETQHNYISFEDPGYYVYEIPENTINIEIKVWGASAGEEIPGSNIQPGKGGYSYGILNISENADKIIDNKLYIYIGGMADTGCNLSNEEEQKYASCGGYFSCGGYNGGGSGAKGYYNNGHGGGGATDIRFVGGEWNNIDSLNSRFIVAGGGGGMANITQNDQKYSGGAGGGGNNAGNFVYSNIINGTACFGEGGTLSNGGLGGNCSALCNSHDIFYSCITEGLCTNINTCLNQNSCLNLCKNGNKCTIDSTYNICRSSIVSDDCRFNSGIFGAGGNGREGYYGGSGGGGGYYGGGASSEIIQQSNTNNYIGSGGGGSGYINTSVLTDIGGENGVRFGHGRVELYIVGGSVETTTEILNSENDDILVSELPDNIKNDDLVDNIVSNNNPNIDIDGSGSIDLDNINSNSDNNISEDNNTTEDENNNENSINRSCVITNKITDPNIGVITYKTCYSNCQPRVRNESLDTITVNNEKLYPDFSITSFDPDNVPTDEEVKMFTSLVREDNNERVELNTYWKDCEFIVRNGMRYSETYDGCYFGDVEYPDGKDYLAIFDTLDCKMAHYFNLAAGNAATIVWIIVFFYIFGVMPGLYFTFFIFFMLIMMLLITTKIFYLFVTNVIGITFMVFISPITIPFALVSRFKNIFDAWLNNLIGFCLQLIMVVAFTGFVITSIDSLALGDAKYINHNENGRLPTLYCDSRDGFSVLCVLSANATSGEEELENELLKFLGISPIFMIIDYIFFSEVGFINMLVELLSFLIVTFVLSELLDKIPNLSQKVFSGPGMQKADTNLRKMSKIVTTYAGRAPYELVRGARVIANSAGREITQMFTGEKGSYKKIWADRVKPVKDFFSDRFTTKGRQNFYGISRARQDKKAIKAAKKAYKNRDN